MEDKHQGGGNIEAETKQAKGRSKKRGSYGDSDVDELWNLDADDDDIKFNVSAFGCTSVLLLLYLNNRILRLCFCKEKDLGGCHQTRSCQYIA